jgi:hypothetical protein
MLKRIAGKWAYEFKSKEFEMIFSFFIHHVLDAKLHQECLKLERQEYIFRFLNPEE